MAFYQVDGLVFLQQARSEVDPPNELRVSNLPDSGLETVSVALPVQKGAVFLPSGAVDDFDRMTPERKTEEVNKIVAGILKQFPPDA